MTPMRLTTGSTDIVLDKDKFEVIHSVKTSNAQYFEVGIGDGLYVVVRMDRSFLGFTQYRFLYEYMQDLATGTVTYPIKIDVIAHKSAVGVGNTPLELAISQEHKWHKWYDWEGPKNADERVFLKTVKRAIRLFLKH